MTRMEVLHCCIKKRTADQWPAPAVNESVVISYGIVIAKVQTIPEIQKFMEQICVETM